MRGFSVDLMGRRFDRLTVISKIESTASGILWLCVCQCGNHVGRVTSQLTRTGKFKGCNLCYGKARASLSTKHGATAGGEKRRPRIYRIWKSMRMRCNDPNQAGYKYYGGKGIKICPEWATFPAFMDWANANGYADNLTIDRLNSNGNYEPANCEWVTKSENSKRASRGKLRLVSGT